MVAVQHPRPSRIDMLRKEIDFRDQLRKIRSGERQAQHLQAVSQERAK